MEVSAATDALLRKLRIEQRKLQQNIHFPDGVDPETDDTGTRNNSRRERERQEEQDQQQQQNNTTNQHEQRYRAENETHLLLEIESLHDRIRNLESSLQYERERHQQTRDLLRVALKPPPEEQERIHNSYHRQHSGAFVADGPNIRGDDMASILVGAASPGSIIGDTHAAHYHQYRNNNNNHNTPSRKSINNDGIRIAPFPAEGSVLGAHEPDQMAPHYDRYEVYGNAVSSSRAAKLIYEKAHQLDHPSSASRAVLADYQQNQNQNPQHYHHHSPSDDYYERHSQATSTRRTHTPRSNNNNIRSRHMTPTPSRAHTPARSTNGNRTPAARPFGIGEKRFVPISVFGEQSMHRSMYEEGTPRSQVRPVNHHNQNANDHQNNRFSRNGGMSTGGQSSRRRASTPTMTTLRSPATAQYY